MGRREPCHVVVLAAGRGVRAGGPKALVPVRVGGGVVPWWRVQADGLAAVGVRATWVVSAAVAGAIRASGAAPERLVEAADDKPMFASVVAGLRAVDVGAVEGVFVLPVDTPVPGAEVWEALAGGAGEEPSVPECGGKRGHPVYLPAAWARGLLERLQGGSGAGGAERLDVMIGPARRVVRVEDGRVAVNLNTAEEFAAWAGGAGGAQREGRHAA